MTDPLDALARPPEPRQPRARFTRDLRARLMRELGLDAAVPTLSLPERKPMTTSTTTPATDVPIATGVTPYLTATNAVAALDWYAEAFGAVEQFRVVGDDGRLGHAEFTIGAARFMLSDEYAEMGVKSPTTLGGSATALHLTVTDVDGLFAQAAAAGATSLGAPEDQPHGARHGTLVDPFGHRWMLSQPLEEFDLDAYRERTVGSGFSVVPGAGASAAPSRSGGGIWAVVAYHDALAGIRFLVDVFGFEEQIVVTAPDGRTVVHSQLRWPEGGIVQVATHDPDNVYRRTAGDQALYVVTADPQSVWERCQAAGLTVVREPESPDYDPDGMGFAVRDPDGNIWSFGTYGGESDG
jgi:PhnB protein